MGLLLLVGETREVDGTFDVEGAQVDAVLDGKELDVGGEGADLTHNRFRKWFDWLSKIFCVRRPHCSTADDEEVGEFVGREAVSLEGAP